MRLKKGDSVLIDDFMTLLHTCRKRKWPLEITSVIKFMAGLVAQGYTAMRNTAESYGTIIEAYCGAEVRAGLGFGLELGSGFGTGFGFGLGLGLELWLGLRLRLAFALGLWLELDLKVRGGVWILILVKIMIKGWGLDLWIRL